MDVYYDAEREDINATGALSSLPPGRHEADDLAAAAKGFGTASARRAGAPPKHRGFGTPTRGGDISG